MFNYTCKKGDTSANFTACRKIWEKKMDNNRAKKKAPCKSLDEQIADSVRNDFLTALRQTDAYINKEGNSETSEDRNLSRLIVATGQLGGATEKLTDAMVNITQGFNAEDIPEINMRMLSALSMLASFYAEKCAESTGEFYPPGDVSSQNIFLGKLSERIHEKQLQKEENKKRN